MARFERMYCRVCDQTKNVCISAGETYRSMCHECEMKQNEDEKTKYLNGLKVLTIEERILKIEEWIYDHSKVSHVDYSRMRF